MPSARFVPSVTFECLPEVSPFTGRTRRQGLARASRALSGQDVDRASHGLNSQSIEGALRQNSRRHRQHGTRQVSSRSVHHAKHENAPCFLGASAA